MNKPSEETIKIRELTLKFLADGHGHYFDTIHEFVKENAQALGIDPLRITAPRISTVLYYLTHKAHKITMTAYKWYRLCTEEHSENEKPQTVKPHSSAKATKAILNTATRQIEEQIINAFSAAEKQDRDKARQVFEYGMEIKSLIWRAIHISEKWQKLEQQ